MAKCGAGQALGGTGPRQLEAGGGVGGTSENSREEIVKTRGGSDWLGALDSSQCAGGHSQLETLLDTSFCYNSDLWVSLCTGGVSSPAGGAPCSTEMPAGVAGIGYRQQRLSHPGCALDLVLQKHNTVLMLTVTGPLGVPSSLLSANTAYRLPILWLFWASWFQTINYGLMMIWDKYLDLLNAEVLTLAEFGDNELRYARH